MLSNFLIPFPFPILPSRLLISPPLAAAAAPARARARNHIPALPEVSTDRGLREPWPRAPVPRDAPWVGPARRRAMVVVSWEGVSFAARRGGLRRRERRGGV